MATKNISLELFSLAPSSLQNINDSQLLKSKKTVLAMFNLTLAEVPQVTDVKKVYFKLKQSIEDEDVFSHISRREEKLVPWALTQRIEEVPLFETEHAIPIIFKWLKIRKRHNTIPAFIHVFLLEYPTQSQKFSMLKNAISDLINHAETAKALKIKEWQLNVGLFSPEVMQRFSKIAINESILDCISTFRLYRGLNFGNFFKVGVQSVLTELSASLSYKERTRQAMIVKDLTSSFIDENNEFKYPALKSDFAEGLLTSYQKSPPAKKLKEKLKKLFLKHYGDPRISKEGWTGVSEEAVDVMRSWMVENTMHDFFNLLSHVAKTDSTADHHWYYRKRFWNAYLKKGMIQEAWVALGPRAKLEARAFLGKNSTFATLSGSASNHSSLIMVIGGVLITEWSHSGKYRLWDNDLSRPRLYKRAYRRQELVNDCDYDGAHHSSDTGGWQYRLSTLIRDLTGISVNSREYMNDR